VFSASRVTPPRFPLRWVSSGATRAVLVLGPVVLKFARGERGRRCNLYEAELYRNVSASARDMLCPLLWCAPSPRSGPQNYSSITVSAGLNGHRQLRAIVLHITRSRSNRPNLQRFVWVWLQKCQQLRLGRRFFP
jgi:hypothetical protein